MAKTTSVGSSLFLIIILCHAPQSQLGTITFLRSSVEFTQRTLSCPGEALTLTCTSNGNDIRWESEPSLSMSGDQTTIYTFVHNDVAGTSFSYLRNYTNGTAFFVSTVLEDVIPGGNCNSSITLVPIPNDEGQYPTSFAPNGLFNITCTAGTLVRVSLNDRMRHWVYRVAGVPMPVPKSNAICTYYASDKVVKIEIMGQAITQDDSVELRHYEVCLNGTSMKTNVSAQSKNPNGLFYPVEEDNKPEMAQIVAVDVCNQKSNQTVIRCTTVSPPENPTTEPGITTTGSATTCTCIPALMMIKALIITLIV